MAEVTANGVRLHYERLGRPSGPAVVFIHGLVMDNLASWYFTVANALAPAASVLVYDLRGHGKSERPPSGYTLADMVADLEALLNATVGDGPIALVGNSFGGLLAVEFARAHPERVSKIVLVDAHLGDAGFGDRMAETLELEGEARDTRIAESFKDWAGRHSSRKRNRLATSAAALVGETSLIADLRTTIPLSHEDLAGLAMPILALYGEKSDLRERSERLLSHVPSCTVRIFEGCSHSILWEATDAVREAIVAFVGPAEPAACITGALP